MNPLDLLPRRSALASLVVVGVAGLLVLTSWPVGAQEKTKPADKGLSLFREQVRPLLSAKCLTCHGGDRMKGGLDLSRRAPALKGGKKGPAIVTGQPDKSLLLV